MIEHCRYVWEEILMKKCHAKKWYMIGYSAGGSCARELLVEYSKTGSAHLILIAADFTKKVEALAICDSRFGVTSGYVGYLEKVLLNPR